MSQTAETAGDREVPRRFFMGKVLTPKSPGSINVLMDGTEKRIAKLRAPADVRARTFLLPFPFSDVVHLELRNADASYQSCGGLETGIQGWFEALEASPSHSLVPATIPPFCGAHRPILTPIGMGTTRRGADSMVLRKSRIRWRAWRSLRKSWSGRKRPVLQVGGAELDGSWPVLVLL
jgi:hypothetical protein